MPTLPTQPEPIPGAARYWADGKDVFMRCTDGYVSCIDTKRTEGTALDAAKKWQEKENATVAKHTAK